MSHGTVCYLYSLHPDFYISENIINVETYNVMDNFFNNGPEKKDLKTGFKKIIIWS
jgi:hypothetical protein